MKPASGTLAVWTGEQSACIRITGRATFALSVPFRKVLRHLRESGHSRVLLDLSACQSLDSTFLGILAYEANQMVRKGEQPNEPGMELLNANPNVRETIQDLGVARLVRFAERDLEQADFKDVPAGSPASVADMNRTCLEAHELLMALHPANVDKFRDVVRFFAEELKNNPDNQDAAR